MKKRILIICIFIELAGILCLGIIYIKTHDLFIPSFVTWNKYSSTFTLGGETVNFTLKSRKLTISDEQGKELYHTEKGVFISDVLCTDIDHDSDIEICLMAWKRGSYGNHKPFWLKEDTDNWTQHIFIYEWDPSRTDRLDPKWMSSALGINVTGIYSDTNSRIHLIDDKGNETIWQWDSWGLTSAQ